MAFVLVAYDYACVAHTGKRGVLSAIPCKGRGDFQVQLVRRESSLGIYPFAISTGAETKMLPMQLFEGFVRDAEAEGKAPSATLSLY